MKALLGYWPQAIGVLALIAFGFFLGFRWEALRYAGLQTEFERYKAQVANTKATEESAVVTELRRQLAQKSAAEANNEKVVQQLAQERDSALRDAQLVHWLFNGPAKGNGTSGSVSAAGHLAGAAAQVQKGEASEAEGLLREAAEECISNDDDHDALIDQLLPQLR